MRKIKILIFITLAYLFGCAGNPSPRYTSLENSKKSKIIDQKDSGKKQAPYTINKKNKSIKKQWELYYIVKELIHTPYRWGGEIPHKGMDCSGLTYYAYNERLGYNIPRTAKEQFQIGKKIPTSELQFGDLVFFKTNPRKNNNSCWYLC